MPSRPSRGKRRERHVNVFIQEDAPRGRGAVIDDDDDDVSAVAAEPGENGSANGAAVATARTRRVRAQRASRQARVRSDVFTRTLKAEMRKLGLLTTAILVILIALTFIL